MILREITMKTILVTGGAGYIGSQTVKELIKAGFDVVVIDNLSAGHKEAVNSKAKLEIVDLKNQDKVAAVFKKYPIDAVIDFAAYLAVGESMENPEKYLQNNVINFIQLLDAMREAGCRHIIKSSSAAVYGNPTSESDIPWKEDFVEKYQPKQSALLKGKWDNQDTIGEEFLNKFMTKYEEVLQRDDLQLTNNEKTKLRIPLSIYGLTKLLDEVILKKYDEKYGIKSISLRYFNVCGADPSGEIGEAKPDPITLMMVIIYQTLGKFPELKIFGRDYDTEDGTAVRDYIHVVDIAKGHIGALNYLKKSNQSDIINLGTGKGSSVLEVISAAERASGKKVKTKDYPRRSGDATISVADPTKAHKLLGWEAKFNLDDMARTVWKWHSSHPNGYKS